MLEELFRMMTWDARMDQLHHALAALESSLTSPG